MKTINQSQIIEGNAGSYLFEKIIGKSMMRFTRNIQKAENNLVVVLSHFSLTKKKVLPEETFIEIDQSSTENILLDMYYAEGMKLFSQGKYAGKIIRRKEGEEL